MVNFSLTNHIFQLRPLMIQIYFSSRVGESPDPKPKNLFVLVRCSNTPPCGATELCSRVT